MAGMGHVIGSHWCSHPEPDGGLLAGPADGRVVGQRRDPRPGARPPDTCASVPGGLYSREGRPRRRGGRVHDLFTSLRTSASARSRAAADRPLRGPQRHRPREVAAVAAGRRLPWARQRAAWRCAGRQRRSPGRATRAFARAAGPALVREGRQWPARRRTTRAAGRPCPGASQPAGPRRGHGRGRTGGSPAAVGRVHRPVVGAHVVGVAVAAERVSRAGGGRGPSKKRDRSTPSIPRGTPARPSTGVGPTRVSRPGSRWCARAAAARVDHDQRRHGRGGVQHGGDLARVSVVAQVEPVVGDEQHHRVRAPARARGNGP